MGKIKNLTSKIFGHLKVIGFVKVHNNLALWECICGLCQNKINVSSSDLTFGNKKSCGCLKSPNLVGKKFNKLLVIELLAERKNKQRQWKCQCECGNIVNVVTCLLTKSKKKSCGCNNIKDLSGKKYGLLTVLCYSHTNNNYKIYWRCKCKCGNIKAISGSNLKSGQIKSCGCSSKEIREKTNLDRYNCNNVMQDPIIATHNAKNQNNSFVLVNWETMEEVVCVGSFEKNVVNYLNENKIRYKWQHKTFSMTLSNGIITTYRPDLYLIGKRNPWVEIKGYFRKDAEEKWKIFNKIIKPNSELWDEEKLKSMGIL